MATQPNSGPVVLINPFIVPAGSEQATMAMWEKIRAFLSTQPGFISTRLHRAMAPDAHYTLINIAHWESVQAFQAAMQALQQSANIQMVEGVRGDPQLYQVIAQ